MLVSIVIAKAEAVNEAEEKIEEETEKANHKNSGEDVLDADKAFRAHHHRSDTVGSGDDLGNDKIGPADRQHLPCSIDIAGESSGKNDPPDHVASFRSERPRTFYDLGADGLGIIHEQGDEEPDYAENKERNLLTVTRAEPHEK